MMKWAAVAIVLLMTVVLVPAGWTQQQAGGVKPAAVQEDTNLDNYIQVLRSNLRTRKVEIVTEAMEFSDAEAKVFWPIYRNYELDLSKLNDQVIALIKDYADAGDKVAPEKAKQLAEKSFDLEQQRTDLKRKYFKELTKVMAANRVAKFFQVDRRLDLLINIQMASQIPLMD